MTTTRTATTIDWPDSALDAFVALSVRLDTQPDWLLGCLFSESNAYTHACCRSKAGNPVAVGLNQLLCQRPVIDGVEHPSNLEACGWTQGVPAYLASDVETQLPVVERYFAPHRGSLVSLDALYLVNFLPADIAHGGDPSFVLVDPRPASARRAEFYAWNPGLDHDKKGFITVGDLGDAVRRACTSNRWVELSGRLADAVDRAATS